MADSDDGQAFLAEFGRRLRAVRRYRDITQDELAGQVGTSRTRLSRIERGRINVTLDSLYRIARALDVHPAALLDDRTDVRHAPPYPR